MATQSESRRVKGKEQTEAKSLQQTLSILLTSIHGNHTRLGHVYSLRFTAIPQLKMQDSRTWFISHYIGLFLVLYG